MALMDFKLGEVGGIFTSLREALTGEKIQDPTKILEQVAKLETTFLEAQSKIISTEAKSEHWITASWRPITMLVFVFIIASNYIITPYAMAIFSFKIPPIEIPPDMWDLLKLGLTGYVLSRGAEKAIKNWRDK